MGSKKRALARKKKQRIELIRLEEARKKNDKLCLSCGNEIKQVFVLTSSTQVCESCLLCSLTDTVLRDINVSNNQRNRRYG